MKGDFSRIRVNPAKHYAAVLNQQGRVDLDVDTNEQCFIDLAFRETTNSDVIGAYGGPENDAGFAIKLAGDQISIGPGRYYVHGILVENASWINYDDQPYLLDSGSASDLLNQLAQAGGSASLGFGLEVWLRLATALDDPCLLEPALGQADTTARLQVVWRVVGSVSPPGPALPSTQTAPGISSPGSATLSTQVAAGSDPVSRLSPCCQVLYKNPLTTAHTGKMGASLAQAGSDCGCQPIAAAGYQGLENQLYRVEIHTGGDRSASTFKWSRENGSVVTQVAGVGVSSPVITVASLGPDANLGFQAGQWVELSDDSYQFGQTPNQPGPLFQIASVNQAAMQVTLATPVYGIDVTKNARMRRWDQSGASASASGIPVSGTHIPLESGIHVDFTNGQFQPGDYWTIPARTANGQIDWPPCGGDGSQYQPSAYVRVYPAPLACITLRRFVDAATARSQVSRFLTSDCRLLFPPLTAVNAETAPAALHVAAVTWSNDELMTTDMLLEKGLAVTFDQATTCPWGGGNFQVTIEPPYGLSAGLVFLEGRSPGVAKPTFSAPPGTDSFIRTVFALDPPLGITVSGRQVSWLTPVSNQTRGNFSAFEVLAMLNILLSWLNPIGYARVRVRLIGGAIYGSGPTGNLYLDGQSRGLTDTRAMDGSERVSYSLPSGDSAAASDYEGWFYLAPTVFVSSVVIQGFEREAETVVSEVQVTVNSNNQVTGLQTVQGVIVSNLQASISLSYPPVAPTTVSLILTGTGVGSIVSIASSITFPAGQQTQTTPINILVNPGSQVTDTVSLIASVPTAVGTLPATTQPTLAITGTAQPPPPIN